ncbi:MAG TPA: GAF domain-containing protein, partial [Kofleriaceae bacterium]|nr:GAF domain-containing protein [Kofleriaceae bacterium]
IADVLATQIGDLCSVLMLSDDGETLEIVAIRGRDTDVVAIATNAFLGKRLAVMPIQRRAMNLGTTFTARHLTAGASRFLTTPERAAFAERIGVHSVTTIGLRTRESAVGVLNLLRHGPDHQPYDDADRDLLQRLALPVARAVGNARLLRQQLDALRGAHAVAVRALGELDALAVMASDALSSPLPAVRGYAEALHDQIGELVRNAGAEHLPRMRVDATELRVTIDDLLR